MPRKLLALNLALAAVSAGLVLYIVRQLAAPMPLPVGGRTAAAAQPAAPVVETPKAPPGAYAIVTSRNLFSPTRTEGPAGPTTIAASPLVRPNLFGIVVRDGGSIAYLEDPVTKRVVGYRVGDKIVGGTVQTIKADSVVIERPEGPLDVRLRDPGKPRAAQPGAPPMGPGGQLQPPPLPGVIPPAASPPQAVPPLAQPPQQPGQPGVAMPEGQPGMILPPGVRRPVPPNLLRRVPPGMSDAPQQ
jgi:hypothetical protein